MNPVESSHLCILLKNNSIKWYSFDILSHTKWFPPFIQCMCSVFSVSSISFGNVLIWMFLNSRQRFVVFFNFVCLLLYLSSFIAHRDETQEADSNPYTCHYVCAFLILAHFCSSFSRLICEFSIFTFVCLFLFSL